MTKQRRFVQAKKYIEGIKHNPINEYGNIVNEEILMPLQKYICQALANVNSGEDLHNLLYTSQNWTWNYADSALTNIKYSDTSLFNEIKSNILNIIKKATENQDSNELELIYDNILGLFDSIPIFRKITNKYVNIDGINEYPTIAALNKLISEDINENEEDNWNNNDIENTVDHWNNYFNWNDFNFRWNNNDFNFRWNNNDFNFRWNNDREEEDNEETYVPNNDFNTTRRFNNSNDWSLVWNNGQLEVRENNWNDYFYSRWNNNEQENDDYDFDSRINDLNDREEDNEENDFNSTWNINWNHHHDNRENRWNDDDEENNWNALNDRERNNEREDNENTYDNNAQRIINQILNGEYVNENDIILIQNLILEIFGNNLELLKENNNIHFNTCNNILHAIHRETNDENNFNNDEENDDNREEDNANEHNSQVINELLNGENLDKHKIITALPQLLEIFDYNINTIKESGLINDNMKQIINDIYDINMNYTTTIPPQETEAWNDTMSHQLWNEENTWNDTIFH
ncbi:MAG: hypothetical protein AAFO15_01300 [Pseudomonadota bacterium]